MKTATMLALPWIACLVPATLPAQPDSPAALRAGSRNLAALLSAPIDLAAFKKKKGQSNNGAFKADRLYYRPETPGFYYQYMLFSTPFGVSEADRFGGFSIGVYKFGKTVGDFYDTRETLVALWCRLKDPDLGAADLVGTPEREIKARFGEPLAVSKDTWVYHRDGRALSLHMSGGAVAWFKYARLRRALGPSEPVPELLLREGPG